MDIPTLSKSQLDAKLITLSTTGDAKRTTLQTPLVASTLGRPKDHSKLRFSEHRDIPKRDFLTEPPVERFTKIGHSVLLCT